MGRGIDVGVEGSFGEGVVWRLYQSIPKVLATPKSVQVLFGRE